MAVKGAKALEVWAKRVTEGYPGVKVVNMTSSWRDGLAFCAIIHRFRPNLIDWDSLEPGDIRRTCSLAFTVAERELNIPALLDPEDMVECPRPDKLSILTYLSELYHRFKSESPQGSPVFERGSAPQHHLKRKDSCDSGVSVSPQGSVCNSPPRSPRGQEGGKPVQRSAEGRPHGWRYWQKPAVAGGGDRPRAVAERSAADEKCDAGFVDSPAGGEPAQGKNRRGSSCGGQTKGQMPICDDTAEAQQDRPALTTRGHSTADVSRPPVLSTAASVDITQASGAGGQRPPAAEVAEAHSPPQDCAAHPEKVEAPVEPASSGFLASAAGVWHNRRLLTDVQRAGRQAATITTGRQHDGDDPGPGDDDRVSACVPSFRGLSLSEQDEGVSDGGSQPSSPESEELGHPVFQATKGPSKRVSLPAKIVLSEFVCSDASSRLSF